MGEVHGIDLQRLADLFSLPFVCLCLFMRFDLFIEKGKSHRLLAGSVKIYAQKYLQTPAE